MADHLDTPDMSSPAMDARVDITDIYAFQKPGDAGKSILILNVNPLAPTHANEFRPDALYHVSIDINGDAAEDIVFRFEFNAKEGGQQGCWITRIVEPDGGHGEVHERLAQNAPVSFGSSAVVTDIPGGYRFFAGLRSDPFFFDLVGFLHNFNFTGDDFFANLNVFGIVLEVPNSKLGDNHNIGVWATTWIPATLNPDRMVQVDQMGRPAINTVFNHGEDKNTFNGLVPWQQPDTVTAAGITFKESFIESLIALSAGSPQGQYTRDQATAIAGVLLPDTLTYDYNNPAGFLNGRRLADDVIDAELSLVTNAAITTDLVGPHTDYLPAFPYLGNPHP